MKTPYFVREYIIARETGHPYNWWIFHRDNPPLLIENNTQDAIGGPYVRRECAERNIPISRKPKGVKPL